MHLFLFPFPAQQKQILQSCSSVSGMERAAPAAADAPLSAQQRWAAPEAAPAARVAAAARGPMHSGQEWYELYAFVLKIIMPLSL